MDDSVFSGPLTAYRSRKKESSSLLFQSDPRHAASAERPQAARKQRTTMQATAKAGRCSVLQPEELVVEPWRFDPGCQLFHSCVDATCSSSDSHWLLRRDCQLAVFPTDARDLVKHRL